jgi:hypothetical protein
MTLDQRSDHLALAHRTRAACALMRVSFRGRRRPAQGVRRPYVRDVKTRGRRRMDLSRYGTVMRSGSTSCVPIRNVAL